MYTLQGTLLTLDNVSLSYGTKLVLRDINIMIRDIVHSQSTTGQVITLVGKSGSGKSTLFKVISGLIKPTTGKVLIGRSQQEVCTGEVGMVLQHYPLLEHRTLFNNLKLVEKDIGKIEEYLNEFELTEHKGKYPKELSGGQRQRAAIVQQILCSNHFILLDEPFSGLDPVATEKLCRVINKVANYDDSNTIIISSHILEPSMVISDTLWMLGTTSQQEGATIIHTEDLAAQGLAWDPNIRNNPRFTSKVEEIRQLFYKI